MQGKGILPSQLPLPDLPSNAQYIFHENICFDWGTFGWALKSTALDVGSYKFIVFMNSSIRGPHLPAYWPVRLLAHVTCLPTPLNNHVLQAANLLHEHFHLGKCSWVKASKHHFYLCQQPVPLQAFVHWTSILTSRLIGKVKLVGSTISCEGTFLNGDLTAARRQNPHVQSYVMATDEVSHHLQRQICQCHDPVC